MAGVIIRTPDGAERKGRKANYSVGRPKYIYDTPSVKVKHRGELTGPMPFFTLIFLRMPDHSFNHVSCVCHVSPHLTITLMGRLDRQN